MFCVAQRRDHLLVVGDAVAVEHGDDHGAELRPGVELAEHGQRGLQPRHADRETRSPAPVRPKPRHQPIITPAAADRAEAHRAAFFVFRLEQQFDLEDRAGVVFETADDGGINCNTTAEITCRRSQNTNLLELFKTILTRRSQLHSVLKPIDCVVVLETRMLNRSFVLREARVHRRSITQISHHVVRLARA